MHDSADETRPTDSSRTVLVMGAGAIGCYLGGCLQSAGVSVVFVGRPRVLDALREHGLTVSDLDGRSQHLRMAELRLDAEVPPGLRPALVVLAVKSGATHCRDCRCAMN